MIDLEKEKGVMLNIIPENLNLNSENDLCEKYGHQDDMAISCFYSKENSTKLFEKILNSLTTNGYRIISSVRQDYGAWNVVLNNNKVNLVLRCASIDSVTDTPELKEYFQYKEKGYHSRLDITILIPSKSLHSN